MIEDEGRTEDQRQERNERAEDHVICGAEINRMAADAFAYRVNAVAKVATRCGRIRCSCTAKHW